MPPVDRNQPIRAKSSESQFSLMEFMRRFPDDAACLEWLWRTRYAQRDANRAYCPDCGVMRRFHRVKDRPAYDCDTCGLHIHPTSGTIFHKSSTSLHLWFYAMWLITSTRCGVSAKQLERELGVTYKTAWRMFNLIRNRLMIQDDDEPMRGEIEADETWIGGKMRESEKRKARESGGPTIGPYVKEARGHVRNGHSRRGGSRLSHREQIRVVARVIVRVDDRSRQHVSGYSSVPLLVCGSAAFSRFPKKSSSLGVGVSMPSAVFSWPASEGS